MVKKVVLNLIAIAEIIIFFCPIWLPVVYEPTRQYWHWYEMVLYVFVQAVLLFAYFKIEKSDLK